MKRYSVSIGRPVNEKYSKTGIRYQYWGRTDDAETYIKKYSGKLEFGFQIKDSKTGKIIHKESQTHRAGAVYPRR